ncbi:TetR/AcrR family transcriptional regulator [Muricoccus radiodurans]|uniref:TetR/AcrR family transcriptional regulator n=1 Tax=Muricoccus radiodurans TaxID=2231721 RepID=UPI003CFB4C16
MRSPSTPIRRKAGRAAPSRAAAEPAPRQRLQKEERERHFLDEAIAFFAEVGFSGDTKTLAARLGVAQPLLYRYFASKEALIQRVFEDTFLANWNPLWEEMLTDPGLDVAARLMAFHNDFARVHLKRDRVRLSLFFALRGWDMTTYFRLMRERVYIPIASNLRAYAGEPSPGEAPLHDVEVELAKGVVEKIQYYGIRKWVYEIPSLPSIEPLIEIAVRSLLDGARVAMPQFRQR